jgi:hypothetical protein
MDALDGREAEIAKIAGSKEAVAVLQRHVQEIVEGSAFKSSHRSGQFLRYIVDQSILGNFESLKERVIGMELFGRSPSYDTGEDAIVRVTASDVRKRLLQHYGKYGTTASEFRLSLPLGSYIPEITHSPRGDVSPPDTAAKTVGPAASLSNAPPEHSDSATKRDPLAVSGPDIPLSGVAPPDRTRYRLLASTLAVLLVLMNVALWAFFRNPVSRAQPAPVATLPWSVLFGASRTTNLITSDPGIAFIQDMSGKQVSLSDYANHNYIPDPSKLTPDETRVLRGLSVGSSAAEVDTPIAVHIAEVAETYSKQIGVRAARSIRLNDLKSDENFILLGSPRSNPWSSLYTDQMDFRFDFDDKIQKEFIRNAHPRPNEKSTYVPTALGWATGETFGVIALVQNADQSGQVLLLGGASGEGTEAAGRLATDLARFSNVLRKCGIEPSGPLQHFEILLRLTMMAGSPSHVEVEACHILKGASEQKP